jgi:hypothetical protein
MKLPSLQTLWQNVNQVVRRFPLQFSLAIVCSITWWYLIENTTYDSPLLKDLGKALLIGNFAFTLLLAGDLFSEVNNYANAKKWSIRIIIIAICIGIYFLIDPFANKADLLKAFLMAFAFHLLVSFAPFLGRLDLNGFWQYNKTLFLQFLTAAFYAVVLFAGLSIALVAIDGLFNVEIEGKAYMKLFALVSAGFSSIFFLAGVPTNFTALTTEDSYPKGLKIFTQYVLIPLMTIYLAILLVYEIKIILIWSLPKGIVSSLILGYAVFGILSLLLIHPIKDKPGNGWMKLFSKFFYLMMIPLVVLLILAIIKRTANYGITEPRYILMALAFWLSGITIYFLLSKKQNIKVIPISLFILTSLVIYGPQSAFSISKSSQIVRLTKLMKSKDQNDMKERAAVIRYLVANHGLLSLQNFTHVNMEEVNVKIETNAKRTKAYAYEVERQRIDTAFALLKTKEFVGADAIRHFTMANANNGLIETSGYDAVVAIEENMDSIKYFNGTKFTIKDKLTKNRRIIVTGTIVKVGDELPIHFDLTELSKGAYQASKSSGVISYPQNKMQFSKQTNQYVITLVVGNIGGSYDTKWNEFDWLSFKRYLLIKKK